MREIGTIVRLQIQQARLKRGEKPYRVYDTSPLLSIAQLHVTSHGAQALQPDGQLVIDVHHTDHPQSQNNGGNSLSIGFTSHYARMRERFGAHLFNGCAGENILIDTNAPIGLSDVERGLAIHCAVGAWLRLDQIRVAHPCVEFSRYSLQTPRAEGDSAEIKATLQFLEDGLRGFYTVPANDDRAVVVSVGDKAYLPE